MPLDTSSLTCCDCCRSIDLEDETYTFDNRSLCSACYEDHFDTCSSCGRVHYSDDCICVQDESVCTACYETNGCFCCEACGYEFHSDSVGRGQYCESCWDSLDFDDQVAYVLRTVHNVDPSRPRSTTQVPGMPPERERTRIHRPPNADCCVSKPFDRVNVSTSRIGSPRTFGIELETARCPGAEVLSTKTAFASRSDGSIDGYEFTSTVLRGDEGLKEIEHFCEVAEELGFSIDRSCGFHAHFGIQDDTDQQRFAIFIAYLLTEKLWGTFVHSNRRENTYCKLLPWTLQQDFNSGTIKAAHRGGDIATYRFDHVAEYCNGTERYLWMNPGAACRHGTIEIRLHAGTLSARKITSWVIAHARFMDWAAAAGTTAIVDALKDKTLAEQFQVLSNTLPPEVATFLKERAEYFGTILT